jgi:hypothetical protein
MVKFMPLSLQLRVKGPRHPLDRRLGWTCSWSGWLVEVERLRSLGGPVHVLDIVLTVDPSFVVVNRGNYKMTILGLGEVVDICHFSQGAGGSIWARAIKFRYLSVHLWYSLTCREESLLFSSVFEITHTAHHAHTSPTNTGVSKLQFLCGWTHGDAACSVCIALNGVERRSAVVACLKVSTHTVFS